MNNRLVRDILGTMTTPSDAIRLLDEAEGFNASVAYRQAIADAHDVSLRGWPKQEESIVSVAMERGTWSPGISHCNEG